MSYSGVKLQSYTSVRLSPSKTMQKRDWRDVSAVNSASYPYRGPSFSRSTHIKSLTTISNSSSREFSAPFWTSQAGAQAGVCACTHTHTYVCE